MLPNRSEVFSTSSQETNLDDVTVTTNQQNVNAIDGARTEQVGSAIKYAIEMFFNHLHYLLETDFLYKGSEKELIWWGKLTEYDLSVDYAAVLPLVCATLNEDIVSVLGVTKPPVVSSAADAENAIHIFDNSDISSSDSCGGGVNGQSIKRCKVNYGQTEQQEWPLIKEEPISASHLKPSRSPHLSADSEESYNTININMFKTFCCLYDGFAQLFKSCVEQKGLDSQGQVALIITDPPYNTRRQKNRPNSEHDVFTIEDIVKFVNFIKLVLNPGEHAIIFCSHLQFNSWYGAIHC